MYYHYATIESSMTRLINKDRHKINSGWALHLNMTCDLERYYRQLGYPEIKLCLNSDLISQAAVSL